MRQRCGVRAFWHHNPLPSPPLPSPPLPSPRCPGLSIGVRGWAVSVQLGTVLAPADACVTLLVTRALSSRLLSRLTNGADCSMP